MGFYFYLNFSSLVMHCFSITPWFMYFFMYLDLLIVILVWKILDIKDPFMRTCWVKLPNLNFKCHWVYRFRSRKLLIILYLIQNIQVSEEVL